MKIRVETHTSFGGFSWLHRLTFVVLDLRVRVARSTVSAPMPSSFPLRAALRRLPPMEYAMTQISSPHDAQQRACRWLIIEQRDHVPTSATCAHACRLWWVCGSPALQRQRIVGNVKRDSPFSFLPFGVLRQSCCTSLAPTAFFASCCSSCPRATIRHATIFVLPSKASAAAALSPEHGAPHPEHRRCGGHGHVDAPHERRAHLARVRLPPPTYRRGEYRAR